MLVGLDLDARGAGQGYVHLHNSTNTSAWHTVRIPIYCFNNADGPTTLILGGMHGDEYEAPAALNRLCQQLDPAQLVGRLIILPAMNLPAILAGQRLSPEDGRNLNREFPGKVNGSLTQRMAWFLTDTLIPLADHVIDLHSGGRSLRFAPSILVHDVPDQNVMKKTLAAATAFGAPYTVRLQEDHAEVMIDAVVEGAGKVMIASELGGSGILTRETATLALDGIRRTLASLGHFEPAKGKPPQTRLVRFAPNDGHVLADATAIFEPTLELGTDVIKGQIIGHYHFPDRVDAALIEVLSPNAGVVLCLSGQGLVHRGDVVAVIAQDCHD
jgi:predicted deacylase